MTPEPTRKTRRGRTRRAGRTQMTPTSWVTATDGVKLAVYEAGDPGAATVVAIHGYPDNASVWDGVVQLLRERYHVVSYDVRGAGRSAAPDRRAGYRLDQLEADFDSVIEAVSPDRPVHLLAHDWGAIQGWHAVTDPGFAERVASFTSISGPCLDHLADWFRRAPRAATLRQAAKSWYTLLFRMPVLPELGWRS